MAGPALMAVTALWPLHWPAALLLLTLLGVVAVVAAGERARGQLDPFLPNAGRQALRSRAGWRRRRTCSIALLARDHLRARDAQCPGLPDAVAALLASESRRQRRPSRDLTRTVAAGEVARYIRAVQGRHGAEAGSVRAIGAARVPRTRIAKPRWLAGEAAVRWHAEAAGNLPRASRSTD